MSNNYRNFTSGWVMGGMKFFGDTYGTVENCEIAWNGIGVWFDSCNDGAGRIIVRNNYIHDNGCR